MIVEGISIDEYKLSLLRSLVEKPKYLHMGKSPVSAIQACWEMVDAGLMNYDDGGWVSLTPKGRKLIQDG